jgi:hypothetical protein
LKRLFPTINLLLLLTAGLACADDPGKAVSQKMNNSGVKTISFSDVTDAGHLSKDMRAFAATLNISEAQSALDGGITFELGLQYEGDKDLAVHNPIYYVQYVLKGSDPARTFTGVKPPIPLLNRKGPIDETSDFNFDILGITKNGEDLNVREEVNKPIVTFRKGDRQSYRLRISQFVNQQSGRPEDLPAGTYHVELLLSLIASDATGDAAESRTLRVPYVPVSLK